MRKSFKIHLHGVKNVIFGNNVFRQVLPDRFKDMKRPLVTDKRLDSHINEFKHMFPDSIIYDRVLEEPDTCMVQEIQSYMNHCDGIVALGGGSPIDAAKAARACSSDGSLTLLSLEDSLLPLIAIPTTSGTGSEVTPFSVISTQNKEKRLLKGDILLPNYSFIDPTLTYQKPPMLTAVTGMDALCHSLEAFVSRKQTAQSDAFAIRALSRIGQSIVKSVQDPCPLSRYEMMMASTEAGLAFSQSSVTLVHGMSRPLGRFGIGHGMANAQLLAHVVNFSQNASKERFNIAKSLLFPDRNPSKDLVDLLTTLVHYDLQIPTLREYLDTKNMRVEYEFRIPQMTQEAVDSGSPSNNPIIATHKEIEALYASSLYY